MIINPFYTQHHQGYNVMGNDSLPIREDIMDVIIKSIEVYTHCHSKTFVVFFGLNYPSHLTITDNTLLQVFMDRFLKHLDGTKGLRPMYVWVREQKASHNPHYHIMLLLNGQKIQSRYGIMAEAVRLWGDINQCDGTGLVHYETESMMLRKDYQSFNQDVAQCIYYASYLAKVNTKGSAPHRQREYGCTQLSRFITKHPSR